MKVYVHDKGVTLIGKAWEIQAKLKEYRKDYRLLKDWVNLENTPHQIKRIY
ncbi:Z-ring formation inhibitor MciZ [Bacillus sp. FJAT-49705]|uniref:Z-ring formation inhibitor MciZ n=1 Tax=Cytobacillus citreus TaxID=2833586 RepID=A0ABS5NVG8_9BACI|nr:Z-ring formation inhibitor MciZ [Cytobacillus citreus]MBS4191118.1 Z-ring formation inhibitor MciZ [Cytobacillus citreus]